MFRRFRNARPLMRIPVPQRWLAIVATVVVMPLVLRAEPFSALRFEQYIESLRQQAGIPGLSAAIVQNRALAWERGFGLADVERSLAVTPDTPFPIGGLTTMFSAVQALKCVEQGSLTLDTPVVSYFPAFPEPGTRLSDALRHIVPGGRFVYDPERYDAVAAAVKSCSAKTLRGALTDSVLERLAMVRSVPGHDFATWSAATRDQFPAETVERFQSVMTQLAHAYKGNGKGKPTLTPFAPTTGLTGSTGIVSTVRDLAQFQAALEEGVLLQPDTLKAAWTTSSLADGRLGPHGLGWFVQVFEGQLVVWQFGVIPEAYSSLVITLPQQGVSLILLANSDGLVAPFPLANGDISVSPFARFFIRLFS